MLGNSGASVDSNAMRFMMVLIFALALLFYLIHGPQNSELPVFGIIIGFATLFYTTQFFYSPFEGFKYEGQFLRWASECTSSVLIGVTLMKLESYKTIHKLLPIIVICVTFFLVPATIENAAESGQMHLESGMNYQTMAYTLSFLFALSFYYAFIHKKSTSLIIKCLLIFCIPILAVTCCMAGGRGGLVLLVVYVVFFFYFMLKLKRISKVKLVLLALISAVVFLFVADYLNLWDTAGFNRSSGVVNSDDRFELWESIWHYVVDNNFIGYGLGGDYYTFGFYTHNILLDFILELGAIGLIVMIRVFFAIYKRIFKCLLIDDIFAVIALICIFGLVMNMFSGYWITTYTHWLALGVALTCLTYFKPQEQASTCTYHKIQ